MSQFIELELASGSKAVFHLAGNYVIVDKEKETVKNARFNGKVKGVCLCDGVHNNGGWELSSKYTLESVVNLLKNN
jgi:hypothetical protein